MNLSRYEQEEIEIRLVKGEVDNRAGRLSQTVYGRLGGSRARRLSRRCSWSSEVSRYAELTMSIGRRPELIKSSKEAAKK